VVPLRPRLRRVVPRESSKTAPRGTRKRNKILKEWYAAQGAKSPRPEVCTCSSPRLTGICTSWTECTRVRRGSRLGTIYMFSTPLVDDVTGNGMMDIVVGIVSYRGRHLLETNVRSSSLHLQYYCDESDIALLCFNRFLITR
jgi:hypothetical protein